MKQFKAGRLWSAIRTISETQEGRQALSSTGAAIAASYMGYVGPELLGAMHDALVYYAAKYPFLDPSLMMSSLWSGARHFAGSALDYAADLFDGVGVDMSHTIRESVNAARDFISRGSQRGLESARLAFEETAAWAGGYASEIVTTVKDAAEAGWEGIKRNWGTVLTILVAAKEAYEFYDTGESIYHRLFKRRKKEVAESGAKSTREVSLTVNAGLAGAEAIEAADAQARRQTVATRLKVDIDKVIWVSERILDEIRTEGDVLYRYKGSLPRELSGYLRGQLRVDPTRQIKISRRGDESVLRSPNMGIDLSAIENIELHVSKKGDILGESHMESPDTLARLNELRQKIRKRSTKEFDLPDPMAFAKGAGAANDNLFEGRRADDGPGLM